MLADDYFDCRHVTLPKNMLKVIPKDYFDPETGTLRILQEEEWRGLGITQSLGWEHYETHSEYYLIVIFIECLIIVVLAAPEPHILLFK